MSQFETRGEARTENAKGEAGSLPPKLANESVIFCTQCGVRNKENNYTCSQCGCVLHQPPAQYAVVEDCTLGGLIPYKNGNALFSYYLAVFSLIPLIGGVLGIVAVVMGIRGLQFAKLHPETKGKGHAWFGIILGGLCASVTILIVLLLVIAVFVN